MSYERIDHAGGAVITTLATAMSSVDGDCAVVDGTGWPLGTVGPFFFTIYELVGDVRLNEEKIQATVRVATLLGGLARGVDGTTAVDHAAGSIVEHVFTAIEADEANAAVAATLGQITAKGDLLVGADTNELEALTVGTDDRVLITDSTQTGGVRWGTVNTAQLAAGAVGSANLQAGAVLSANIETEQINEGHLDSLFWHRETFSVTSGSSGDSTIPHGAPFTPTFVQIMFTGPSTTPNVVAGYVVRSITGTDVVVRCTAAQSGSVAGLLASGQTLAGTILSLA